MYRIKKHTSNIHRTKKKERVGAMVFLHFGFKLFITSMYTTKRKCETINKNKKGRCSFILDASCITCIHLTSTIHPCTQQKGNARQNTKNKNKKRAGTARYLASGLLFGPHRFFGLLSYLVQRFHSLQEPGNVIHCSLLGLLVNPRTLTPPCKHDQNCQQAILTTFPQVLPVPCVLRMR